MAPQVLQGLKECAVALADPFGGDAVDFDVDLFLANILSNARALIAKDAAFQLELQARAERCIVRETAT